MDNPRGVAIGMLYPSMCAESEMNEVKLAWKLLPCSLATLHAMMHTRQFARSSHSITTC
jgi:hypothetical protein